MTRYSGSSSSPSLYGSFHSSEKVSSADSPGCGPLASAGSKDSTPFDLKSKRMSQGSQVVMQSIPHTVLNDLNPPTTSSQLQYSPTMSLKGGKGVNKVNIMASPVQIKLNEPLSMRESKGLKSIKTKKSGGNSNTKNEMVFVNYSVKDTTEAQKKKKQSKRDRMLRIFTGGNSNVASSYSSNGSQKASSVDRNIVVPNSQSGPPSATKRSYGSFLKCHPFTSNTPATNCEPLEVVQKSDPIPHGQRPPISRSVSSNVSLVRNNGRCSLSQSVQQSLMKNDNVQGMDLLKFNMAKTSGANNLDSSQSFNPLQRSKSQSYAEFRRGTARKMESKSGVSISSSSSFVNVSSSQAPVEMVSSTTSQMESEDDKFDHHYMDPYQEHHHLSSTTSLHDDTSDSVSACFTDENDASVAFSKLFTRKRTNTGGSISSLLSLSANQSAIPPLDRHQSSNSVSSSFRYSPIRSGSQSRTRSNTRTSGQRMSRDLSNLPFSIKAGSGDSHETLGMESYLDTQQRTTKLTHRHKQESISDISRLHSTQGSNINYPCANSTTSMSSSASTPATVESSLIQFPKQATFSIHRDGSLDLDNDQEQAEDGENVFYKPTIREDDEYDSAMNTSGSSSHMYISSVSTVSTRQTGMELSDPNSYGLENVVKMGNVDQPLGRTQVQVQELQIDPDNELVMNSKPMAVEHSNELFNNYMDLNFDEIPPSHPFTDNSNLLHQVMNGTTNDTSTITSGMNISPITVTGGNTSQDEVSTIVASSNQIFNPNLSFQSRIMNDIDRLARGFNMSDMQND